jgi:AcrR family transcriptional regulator
MADTVKRRYRSEVRSAQAHATRARILDAAQPLLLERGYHATSIEAIAAAAGVAPQTIYNGFGTKRMILGALIRRAMRGAEHAPLPLRSPAGAAVRDAPDATTALRLFADDISRRLERVAPLVMLVNAAAPADAELNELLALIHRQRLGQLRGLVRWLSAKSPLRLSAAEAADTLWLLVSAESYLLATTRRGWSRARYARWLADSLATLLIDDQPPR